MIVYREQDLYNLDSNRALISIADPDGRNKTDRLLKNYRGPILRLDFEDNLIAPEIDHLKQSMNFYVLHNRYCDIHCFAGISRSTAIALYLFLAVHELSVDKAWNLLLSSVIQKYPHPNKRILEYIEYLLDYPGFTNYIIGLTKFPGITYNV